MINIAKNDQYQIDVNLAKNRAFLKIKGFWREEEITNYLTDWDKALKKLGKEFTLLTDAREMAIHPGDVRAIHKIAQNKLVAAGVKKVAEIQKKKISEMQLDGVSKDSNMPKKNFNNLIMAEQWLDN